MALSYEVAVRKWAAGKLSISPELIDTVSIETDSGWGGTEVTAGDPPSCIVQARLTDGTTKEVLNLFGEGRMYSGISWNFVDLLREILDVGDSEND